MSGGATVPSLEQWINQPGSGLAEVVEPFYAGKSTTFVKWVWETLRKRGDGTKLVYLLGTNLEKSLLARYLRSGQWQDLVEEGKLANQNKLSVMTFADFKHLVGVGGTDRLPERMVVLLDDEMAATIDGEIAKGLVAMFVKERKPTSVKMVTLSSSVALLTPRVVLKCFGLPESTEIPKFRSGRKIDFRLDNVIEGFFESGSDFLERLIQRACESIVKGRNVVVFADNETNEAIVNMVVDKLDRPVGNVWLRASSELGGGDQLVDKLFVISEPAPDTQGMVVRVSSRYFSSALSIPNVGLVFSMSERDDITCNAQSGLVENRYRDATWAELMREHALAMRKDASGNCPMFFTTYSPRDVRNGEVVLSKRMQPISTGRDLLRFAFEMVYQWPGMPEDKLPVRGPQSVIIRDDLRHAFRLLMLMKMVERGGDGFVPTQRGTRLGALLKEYGGEHVGQFHSMCLVASIDESTSAKVKRTLVRLAVIASYFDDLVEIRQLGEDEFPSISSLSLIGRYSWGPASPLIYRGALWVALGAWEGLRTSTDNFQQRVDDFWTRVVSNSFLELHPNVGKEVFIWVQKIEKSFDLSTFHKDQDYEIPFDQRELDILEEEIMLAWLPNLINIRFNETPVAFLSLTHVVYPPHNHFPLRALRARLTLDGQSGGNASYLGIPLSFSRTVDGHTQANAITLLPLGLLQYIRRSTGLNPGEALCRVD